MCVFHINILFLEKKLVYLQQFILRGMNIKVEININKRIWGNIIQYCEANGLNIEEYASECLEKQNNIDRYGDLNALRTVIKTEIPQKEEENSYNVEHKPKNAQEVVENAEKPVEETTTTEHKPENVVEVKRKRRRTLKTK